MTDPLRDLNGVLLAKECIISSILFVNTLEADRREQYIMHEVRHTVERGLFECWIDLSCYFGKQTTLAPLRLEPPANCFKDCSAIIDTHVESAKSKESSGANKDKDPLTQ